MVCLDLPLFVGGAAQLCIIYLSISNPVNARIGAMLVNLLTTYHNYSLFSSVLVAGKITVIGNEMDA